MSSFVRPFIRCTMSVCQFDNFKYVLSKTEGGGFRVIFKEPAWHVIQVS